MQQPRAAHNGRPRIGGEIRRKECPRRLMRGAARFQIKARIGRDMQRQRALFPRKKLIFERTDAEEPERGRRPRLSAAVEGPLAHERTVLLHKAHKTAHRVLVDLFGDAEAHILLMRPRRG